MAKVVTQKKEYVPKSTFHRKSHFSDYVKLNNEYFSQNPSNIAKQYAKEPKKPKKLSKLLVNLFVVCSVVVLVVVSSVVCSLFLGGGGSNTNVVPSLDTSRSFYGLLVRPEGDDSVDLSGFSTDREKASYLYLTASKHATNSEYFYQYNRGVLYMNMMGNNVIDIDAVTMKTQQEYFNVEYHLKNSIPILDTFLGPVLSKSVDIVTTERFYTNVTRNDMIYQKVRNNDLNENGIPYAEWSTDLATPVEKSLEKLVFNKNQDGYYRITNHTINDNTISDAEVIYDEEGGYYDVSLTLDPTLPETVEFSLADICEGTGDPNASYSYLKINFTVWDNGSFRTFNLIEKWNANVIMSLEFELQTNWEISYDERDCDIDNFYDAYIMKEMLGEK